MTAPRRRKPSVEMTGWIATRLGGFLTDLREIAEKYDVTLRSGGNLYIGSKKVGRLRRLRWSDPIVEIQADDA